MKLYNLIKINIALILIFGMIFSTGCSLLKDDSVMITDFDEESEGEFSETQESEEDNPGEKADDTGNRDEAFDEALEDNRICVYVCGAVASPGVYELEAEARAVDAVEAAGGFASDADTDVINLAKKVCDGEQLYIPFESDNYSPDVLSDDSSGQVNINTAGADELKTLPGIGDTKAAAIIEYREQNGDFKSIEEITNVNGIGDSLYNQIKDYITV